jgi:V8-like Glu-specific endopeptidase
VISNAVSPGNSGSPVLLRSGLLAGMVVSAFEGEHEGGRSVMQAALSASEITAFLGMLQPPEAVDVG